MSTDALTRIIHREAVLSGDGRYRYRLERRWGSGPTALFVMLNPSTADAHGDDPTVRRCVGFARCWGLDGIVVVNLFAYRSPKPSVMWSAARGQIDIVGPDNDRYVEQAAAEAADQDAPIVAAWGALAPPSRVAQVRRLPNMGRLMALGVTQNGQPRHPGRLAGAAQLAPWEAPDA